MSWQLSPGQEKNQRNLVATAKMWTLLLDVYFPGVWGRVSKVLIPWGVGVLTPRLLDSLTLLVVFALVLVGLTQCCSLFIWEAFYSITIILSAANAGIYSLNKRRESPSAPLFITCSNLDLLPISTPFLYCHKSMKRI